MRPMEGTLDPAEKARLLSEFDAAVVASTVKVPDAVLPSIVTIFGVPEPV